MASRIQSPMASEQLRLSSANSFCGDVWSGSCGHVTGMSMEPRPTESRSYDKLKEAYVSYPIAKARGLHLRSITLTPLGALFAVHPYRVFIRWPADCLSGAVRPVYVQATPTISPTF